MNMLGSENMKSDENLLTCKVWHDNPQWLLFYSSFTEQLPDERLVSQAAFGRASVGSGTLGEPQCVQFFIRAHFFENTSEIRVLF